MKKYFNKKTRNDLEMLRKKMDATNSSIADIIETKTLIINYVNKHYKVSKKELQLIMFGESRTFSFNEFKK